MIDYVPLYIYAPIQVTIIQAIKDAGGVLIVIKTKEKKQADGIKRTKLISCTTPSLGNKLELLK